MRLPRTFRPDDSLIPYNADMADGQKLLWRLNEASMVCYRHSRIEIADLITLVREICGAHAMSGCACDGHESSHH